MQQVIKNHLPHYLPALEELHDGKLIMYPPQLMYNQIYRSDGGVPVAPTLQGVSVQAQSTKATVTHMSASAYMDL